MNEHEGRTFEQARAEIAVRNVTAESPDQRGRYVLYRLCTCLSCDGSGKTGITLTVFPEKQERCGACRGEGKLLQELATCSDYGEIGMAIVTMGRESEWDGCPFGLRDSMAEDGEPKWLIKPWLPSARNVSDAGRTLRQARK